MIDTIVHIIQVKKNGHSKMEHIAQGCTIPRQEGRTLEQGGSDSPEMVLVSPGTDSMDNNKRLTRLLIAVLVFHQVPSKVEKLLDLNFISHFLP